MTGTGNTWQTLSSTITYRNSYYEIRDDAVIRPDGSEGTYSVIESRGSVFIIALSEETEIYLVQLFRYTTGAVSTEIPAGGIEENEDPLSAAQRELVEETGIHAGTWRKLGVLHPSNGILNQEDHVFLATDLSSSGTTAAAAEGITGTTAVPLPTVLSMIRNGEITDAQSIAAIMLAVLEVTDVPS